MPRHESSPPAASAAGQPGDGAHGGGLSGDGLRWDAIIVAGGRAKRLGGIDKTALVWQGRSLLDGVVAAASGARRTCVVGSDADLPASVLRAVERPRWGGPAAAVVAGLEALAEAPLPHPEWIVVLAGDLVRADDAVHLLLDELTRIHASTAVESGDRPVEGLISVDGDGRRQPLLAVYLRTALLRAAAARPAENLAVTSLIGGLDLVEVRLPAALSDDVDTPADAARLGIELPAPAAPQGER